MNDIRKKHVFFLITCMIALAMIFGPIRGLLQVKTHSEYYSHIVLIPFVTAFLIFNKRKEIDVFGAQTFRPGIVLATFGLGLYLFGMLTVTGLNQNNQTSLKVFSAILFLLGSFTFTYGLDLFKKLCFPLLFLFFMVPFPTFLMDSFIRLLQVGSTEFVNLLMTATGVPFLREGFVFHLSGMSIEVAKECSGIRSSLALLITALLAGHLFLKTGWKKVLLAVLIIPITMFKNGIRILSLTLLGTYVDSRILTNSTLHTDGGILFFVLALMLMAPILYVLRKGEKEKVMREGKLPLA